MKKKNWIMKVAAGMLGLTMISASFVGSTFAKYVTKAQGHDHARVAAWGVLVDVEGGRAFDWRYAAQDDAYLQAGGQYSVVNRWGSDGQVVAPGTGSANLGTNLKATVIGQPEVAARYTIEAANIIDIRLPAGEYTDFTEAVPTWDQNGNITYGYTDKFTLDKDYTPIKWNLVITKGSTTVNVVEAIYDRLDPSLLALAEQYGLTRSGCSFFDAIAILKKVAGNDAYTQIVEQAIGNIVSGGRNFQLDVWDTRPNPTYGYNEGPGFELSYDFDPNKEMNFTFELTWEWAFEQINDPTNPDPAYTALYDKADTFLGNLAAYDWHGELPQYTIEFNAANNNGASTAIEAELTATATQID